MRNRIGLILESVLSHFIAVVIPYNYSSRINIFKKVLTIKKEKKAVAKTHELYIIYSLVKSVDKIDGDIAEVGVYRGTTAKVICESKGDKALYLFDTFKGLPKPQAIDVQFFEGEYESALTEVKRYLTKYSNVSIYKGLFPKTANPIYNKKFSFLHLDVDLYKSTKDSLHFFYPRMSRGGIMLSHDYVSPGVYNAFTEFFADKPEYIIELPGIQCMVVKQ